MATATDRSDLPGTIRFAASNDHEALRRICVAAGMDLAGEVEEHLVITDGPDLVGGAMLAQTDHDAFHLLLVAVDAEHRGDGAGGRLLHEIVEDPWRCCRDALQGSGGTYEVTTVARGTATGFYRRHGFAECDFTQLPDLFRDQCWTCPDRDDCKPVAMRFEGGCSRGPRR